MVPNYVSPSGFANRFPMTRDTLVKFISGFALVIMAVVIKVQLTLVWSIPGQVRWLVFTALGLGLMGLTVTVMLAPQAVRVDHGELVIERWLWSDFRVPLRQLTDAKLGPAIKLAGQVRRVVGNGGLMGFTGLFHVRDVGTVRVWATRLNAPTVLLHRVEGRPLLLGVDDSSALLDALRRNGVKVS